MTIMQIMLIMSNTYCVIWTVRSQINSRDELMRELTSVTNPDQ